MKRNLLTAIVRDVWDVGLAVLLALAALETWQGGFVSRFLNLHLVVLFLVAVSVILLIVHPEKPGKGSRPYVALQAIGVVAAVAVWSYLPEGVRPFWRAIAALGALMAALLAWPLINRD